MQNNKKVLQKGLLRAFGGVLGARRVVGRGRTAGLVDLRDLGVEEAGGSKGVWGLGFEVQGKGSKMSLGRGFSSGVAGIGIGAVGQGANESLDIKYNRLDKVEYSAKDTSEYWSIFGFNLMQKESEMGMLKVILAEIPMSLKKSIMEKLEIIYTICSIHPELQRLYISRDLQGLITKSSREQMEHYQQQYTNLCNLIQEAIPYMSSSICLDMIRFMQANKFYSHSISVGLFSNMYSKSLSKDSDLSDQDFAKSVDYLSIQLKRYTLPINDPEDWGVARSLMGELMNYSNMNYVLNRSIEFCQDEGSRLNNYFVADLITSIEQMATTLPINHPKKLFIIRVVSAWLYRQSANFENQTLGENQKLLSVIVSIVNMGGSSAPIRKVTTDLETIMLKKCRSSRESFLIVMNLLRVYSQQQTADKEHFEKSLRPIIMDFMKEHILKVSLVNLTLITSYMMLFTWKDPQFADLVVSAVNLNCPDFAAFQNIKHQYRSQLHRAINYLLLKRFFSLKQVADLKRVSDYLNADCICHRLGRELTTEPFLGLANEGFVLYPDRQDSPRMLWCNSHEPSVKLCLEDNSTSKTSQDFTQDNYTEVLTKRALKDIVADIFANKLEVSDTLADIAVCTYKWDFVLKLEGFDKPIGFEVSGLSYRDQERRLASKKKVKIEYLAMVGYFPIVLDISTKGLKTLYTEGKMEQVGYYLTVMMLLRLARFGGKAVKLKPGKYQSLRTSVLNQVELLESPERATLVDLQTEQEFAEYLEALATEGRAGAKD